MNLAKGGGALVQPVDPVNDATYHYRYKSDKPPAQNYELDVVLRDKAMMKNDGGNNLDRYEIGTDLTLLP